MIYCIFLKGLLPVFGAPNVPAPPLTADAYRSTMIEPLCMNHPTLNVVFWVLEDQLGPFTANQNQWNFEVAPFIGDVNAEGGGGDEGGVEAAREAMLAAGYLSVASKRKKEDAANQECRLFASTIANVHNGLVRELRFMRPWISQIDAQDSQGISLLHACLMNLRDGPLTEVVRFLIEECGASSSMRTSSSKLRVRLGISVPCTDLFEPFSFTSAFQDNSNNNNNNNNNNAGNTQISRCGYAPLHLAVIYDHEDVVSYLLARGVSVNQRSLVGAVTPLHLAAAHRNASIVQLLLENGAGIFCCKAFTFLI